MLPAKPRAPAKHNPPAAGESRCASATATTTGRQMQPQQAWPGRSPTRSPPAMCLTWPRQLLTTSWQTTVLMRTAGVCWSRVYIGTALQSNTWFQHCTAPHCTAHAGECIHSGTGTAKMVKHSLPANVRAQWCRSWSPGAWVAPGEHQEELGSKKWHQHQPHSDGDSPLGDICMIRSNASRHGFDGH